MQCCGGGSGRRKRAIALYIDDSVTTRENGTSPCKTILYLSRYPRQHHRSAQLPAPPMYIASIPSHELLDKPKQTLFYKSTEFPSTFRHTVPNQACDRSAQNRNGRGQVIPLGSYETRTRYNAPPRIRSESTAHRRRCRSLGRRVNVSDYGLMMCMSDRPKLFQNPCSIRAHPGTTARPPYRSTPPQRH